MRAVEQVARTYTPDNQITLYSVINKVDFGCIMGLNSLNREQLDLHYSFVMGRRGMTAVKEFFIGSISQKVLHAVKDKSVLIVG